MNLKQQFIAQYNKPQVKAIDLEGFAEPVYVRALTGREQAEYEAKFKQLYEANDPDLRPYCFVTFVCDSEGNRPYSEADMVEVTQLSWHILQEVANAGIAFNLSHFYEQVESAKKN